MTQRSIITAQYHVECTGPCHDPFPKTPHIVHQPPRTPKGTPNAPPNFRPCPTPTLANSDTSLANFGACPAATDTYPGPPEPREPPPLFPIFATPSSTKHPDLFRSITTTSGQPAFSNDPINVSAQHDPRSQLTPAPSVELRQAPPPQPTYPKVLRYLPVLSQSPGLVSSPFRYRSHYRFVSLPESTLVPYQPHSISSDAVSVTPSDRCAQVFINPNDLTNSVITITNPDTPLPGPNLTLRLVPDPISSK
ncbi:hypothetical protein E4T56_gene5645 [Termitomyces sp. T112]|nr:hypothetical protein E4T56_gene5645 [Termitomyces sp. T112]